MVRQILNTDVGSRQKQRLNVRASSKRAQKMSAAEMERLLRKKRSKRYMDAAKGLDAGGHALNQQQVENLINNLKDELGKIDENLPSYLLGIVATCYLGGDYEVHTLDLTKRILVHLKKGQRLPGVLEKARGIAMRGGYAYIEVYDEYCCAVSDSGDVSIIKG